MKPLAVIFVLILLTVGFRIVHLRADPPSNFCWSGGYFADEGYWSHNARNNVLFGNAVQDEWDARIVSPVFTRVQNSVFAAFGPGLAQVRLIGIFSALLIALTAYFLFARKIGTRAAFLFAVLCALNYPMLVLARQGILDSFSAALFLLSLGLLFSSSAILFFMAGILFVLACVTKYLMIYTIAVVAAAIYFNKTEKRFIAAFAAGLAVAAITWLFTVYIPNRDLLGLYNSYYSSQQSWNVTDVMKNILLQPFYLYFVKTPAILFFANLFLFYALVSFRKIASNEKIFGVWLIAGIVFFALWKYRPMRYYTSLLLPAGVLAGYCLMGVQEIFTSERRTRLIMALGILIPLAQILFVLFDKWSGRNLVPPEVGIETLDAIVFVALSVAGLVWLFRFPARGLLVPLTFAAAFMLSDVRNYLEWMIAPEYQALEISRELQRDMPEAIMAGQWAPELGLENKIQVVPVWKGFVNSDQPVENYSITHLLLWRYPLGDEVENFKQWYPDSFKHFEEVKTYRIKNSDLVLFRRIQGE